LRQALDDRQSQAVRKHITVVSRDQESGAQSQRE
jgi:hypothetical protein